MSPTTYRDISWAVIIACNMLAFRLYGAKREPWWRNDPRCMEILMPFGPSKFIRVIP
jgi:hypothetical protein